MLDPSITFLNFGSFGACPKPVFEKYQELQRQLEREPVQFIVKDGIELLRQARVALSRYINCHADDLVFVTNPSYAINTIARSFPFKPGDELLATDLEYGAMDRTWNYYCEKAGAKYVRNKVQLPIASKAEFVSEFLGGITDRTKAIFISQITSSTGLILPVREICAEAKKRGLLTIVDGAHVPGHIPLDLAELQADIYTGACHKWMMAPKGASFLYVTKAEQHWVDPLLISWGYQSDFPSHSRFLDYHQTAGTRDYTAFLTIPSCIEFMENNKWMEHNLRCRSMAIDNAQHFCELLGSEPVSPVNEDFLGQMFSIPVTTNDPIGLYQKLFDKYRIEIPVMKQGDKVYVRYSVQAFNDLGDLNHLEMALKEIRQDTSLII